MAVFEMVKYHAQEYPEDIPLRTEECAAHFDITSVKADLRYSLHTEYSYGKRKFNSSLIQNFPELLAAQKMGVPQLWKGNQWAAEFAQFVCALAGTQTPEVIEIHPPFTDYADMDSFVESYKVFESYIAEQYPDIKILIENRCGSVYKGGKFLISKLPEIEMLCNIIVHKNLCLKMAFDIPQIYTAHNVRKDEQYIDLLGKSAELVGQIGGVHLWGKRKSDKGRLVAHCGDLTSYFAEDEELKEAFLREFDRCFGDGVPRKLVLEVNSGNADLKSIIDDVRRYGAVFI